MATSLFLSIFPDAANLTSFIAFCGIIAAIAIGHYASEAICKQIRILRYAKTTTYKIHFCNYTVKFTTHRIIARKQIGIFELEIDGQFISLPVYK